MKISQFWTTRFFLANGDWNTRLLGTVKSFTLGHHQWIPNLHNHNSSKTDISLFTNGMITTLQNWLKLPPKPQKLKSFVFWDGFAIVIDCEVAGNEVFSQNIFSPLENANIRICIRIHSRLYILHVRRYPNQPTPFSCFCIWKILVCVTKTLQELRMLSSVKINCQVTKIQVLDCQFLRCFLVMSNNLSDQMYQRL